MKKNNRIYWVDILRAIALIYMVIYHIFVITNIRFSNNITNNIISFGGEIGVSIFFVISGFSIYKSLNNQKDFKYLDYIKKRLKRIGPHYYISLAISLLFTSAVVYLNKNHILNIISHIFFVHNLFFSYHGAISGVLWTMGVIFQFYLIAPLLKKIIDKKPLLLTIITIILSMAAKYAVFKVCYLKNLDYWHYFIYGRQLINTLDAFVLGMYVSKKSGNDIIEKTKKRYIVGTILTITLLIFMILLGSNSLPIFNISSIYSFSKKGILYFYILDIIIAMLIYFMTKIKYKDIFINKLLCKIADHEYSIYIWHLLLLNNFMNNQAFTTFISNNNPIIVLLFILTILLFLGTIFDIIISNINFKNIKIQKKRCDYEKIF